MHQALINYLIIQYVYVYYAYCCYTYHAVYSRIATANAGLRKHSFVTLGVSAYDVSCYFFIFHRNKL